MDEHEEQQQQQEWLSRGKRASSIQGGSQGGSQGQGSSQGGSGSPVQGRALICSALCVSAPPLPAAQIPVRVIEFLRVHVTALKEIDVRKEQFTASVFLEMVIRGGAKDPHLWAGKNDSRNQFCYPDPPPAHWYLDKQLNYENAVHPPRVLESKCFERGSDLIMVHRVTGTFAEVMELNEFPLDTQHLSIHAAFLCAKGGIVPVELCLPPEDETGVGVVSNTYMQESSSWLVEPMMRLCEIETGMRMPGERRREKAYPTLSASIVAHRRPAFYVWHVILPMALFSLACNLTFFFPRTGSGSYFHRMMPCLSLLITSITFKFVIANMTPKTTYLTLLDKYVLLSNIPDPHIGMSSHRYALLT